MSYNFKSIADVEVVAEPAESANVLIEENGVIKKAPKTAVGGAGSVEPDLVFKVGRTDSGHPKYNPSGMTKPVIISGSLDAVIDKLATGEIPVVKVQYQTYRKLSGGWTDAYGAEYTCETSIYGTDVTFIHDIPNPREKNTVVISMSTDDPSFIEMRYFMYNAQTSAYYTFN